MNDFRNGLGARGFGAAQGARVPAGTMDASVDQGLRSYMLGVYNYMTLGVALTGLVAFFTSQSPALMQALFSGPQAYLVMFAPLGFVLALSFGVSRMSAGLVQILFWAFAAIMGLSLSTIFLAYTGTSITRVFFITAASFAGLSLWGYTTKKDLTGMGSFLIMGLIGLIVASLVNIFLKSSAMEFVISCVGVLVFAGLTAYDTQKIKENYYVASQSGEMMKKVSVMGALSLYLDFINLFLMLLRLFGSSRD